MAAPQQPAAPQGVKKFKKGETIFKEGDKADFVYLIQSGRVSVSVVRPTMKVDLFIAGQGHLLGEQALFGLAKQVFTAEAMSEVQVLELPVAVAKAQYEGASTFLKTLAKTQSDELKHVMTEQKKIKMELENTACPPLFIPRVTAALNLTARHIGKKTETGSYEIAWNAIKIYGIRMFLEAPQRLEGMLMVFTKLKHAEMIYEKNDEGETELSRIIFKNLQILEDFGEFFQYNLYKGGYSEVIHYDEIACNVARLMVKATEGGELDHKGSSKMTFNQLTEMMKEEYGVAVKNTHIDLLEKKGLFMKRTPTDKEVILSFDRKEFGQTVLFWEILNEIDKWNATGRVNMQEEAKKKPKAGEESCPECSSPVTKDQKFCGNCGFKMKAAA